MKTSYFVKLYKTKKEKKETSYYTYLPVHGKTGAAIQRRGPILARIVILSVYGVDTIAIDLSLSAKNRILPKEINANRFF